MTEAEAIDALNGLLPLAASDPERCHGAAEDILRTFVPDDVRAAYDALEAGAPWWACA